MMPSIIQDLEFTLAQETFSEETEPNLCTEEELKRELDRLLLEDSSNQQITDWIQVSSSAAQHLYQHSHPVSP